MVSVVFFAWLLVLQKQAFVWCSHCWHSTYVWMREYVCILYLIECVFFCSYIIVQVATTTTTIGKKASPWICQARFEWICKFSTVHTTTTTWRRRSITRKTFCLLPSLEDLSDFLLNIQQNEQKKRTNKRKKNCVYFLYFSNCHSLGNP